MSDERIEVSQMNEAFVEKGVDIDEYVALQRELEELQKEQGTYEEKGIARLISSYFERKDAREKVRIKKKTLILVALLLGWCGVHRFMLRQKWLGLVYLCFCWTVFPVCMTIVDIIEYLPMKPDEEGYILV